MNDVVYMDFGGIPEVGVFRFVRKQDQAFYREKLGGLDGGGRGGGVVNSAISKGPPAN